MKTFLGILLSLGLLIVSLPGTAAQESLSAFAADINQTLIYTDEDGNDVMTLQVTEVDHDFAGYLDGQYADHGYSYRMVTFTVENVSESTVELNLMSFMILDSLGYSHYRTHLELKEGYELESDIEVAASEVLEQELVFQLPTHADSALFRWAPDYRIALLVNISPDGESPAIAQGLRAPAAISDDFGNEIATVEVLAVRGEWDQHDEWSTPAEGEEYWAVQIRVTNTSDRPVEVRRYRFSLIDQHGVMNRSTWVGMPDDTAEQAFDDATLNPGETVDGFMVFAFPEGNQPVVLVWEYGFGSTAHVILVSPSSADATDIATPVGD